MAWDRAAGAHGAVAGAARTLGNLARWFARRAAGGRGPARWWLVFAGLVAVALLLRYCSSAEAACPGRHVEAAPAQLSAVVERVEHLTGYRIGAQRPVVVYLPSTFIAGLPSDRAHAAALYFAVDTLVDGRLLRGRVVLPCVAPPAPAWWWALAGHEFVHLAQDLAGLDPTAADQEREAELVQRAFGGHLPLVLSLPSGGLVAAR